MNKSKLNNSPQQKLLNHRITKIFLIAAAFAAVFSVTQNKDLLDSKADTALVFKDAEHERGDEGDVGAIYRFESVKPGVDALVEIEEKVNANLIDIDLSGMGDDDSFQPKVEIRNQSNNGQTGFIDFRIRFVQAGTSTPVSISSWTATAVDVDGDNFRIRESVGFEVMDIYTLESPTLLAKDAHNPDILVFDASTTANQSGITISATEHMVTASYLDKKDFLFRAKVIADPSNNGSSSAKQRMFSLNFNPAVAENYVAPGAFPVELIGFDGKVMGDRISLTWSTASELNNDHFEIQRSNDGVGFNTIGEVNGNGNSQVKIDYQFTDNLPLDGTNYYRLKQVDFDGQFEFSETVTLKAEPVDFQIHTFPNPATDFLNVRVRGGQTIGRMDLLNIGGQRVQTPVAKRNDSEWVLTVSHLPAGAYFVRLETEHDQSPLQKVIIQ